MTLDSDFPEMAKASALVAEIAESLRTAKAQRQTQVDALVTAGWSGRAAEQYARAWQDWVEGADRVLDALHAESGLIAATRADLMRTDDDVGGGLGQVAGRLHGRLGPA